MSKRLNFGQLKEVIQPPNLIENQVDSYKEFLQMDWLPVSGKPSASKRYFPKSSPLKAMTVAATSSMSATTSYPHGKRRSKRFAKALPIPYLFM